MCAGWTLGTFADHIVRTQPSRRQLGEYPGAPKSYSPEYPKQIAGTDLTSHTMQEFKGDSWTGLDNLFLAWRREQFRERPEIFYTLIKNSITAGLFDTNPLTLKIANKIVDAAEYFDPTLTQTQHLQDLVKVPHGRKSSGPVSPSLPIKLSASAGAVLVVAAA